MITTLDKKRIDAGSMGAIMDSIWKPFVRAEIESFLNPGMKTVKNIAPESVFIPIVRREQRKDSNIKSPSQIPLGSLKGKSPGIKAFLFLKNSDKGYPKKIKVDTQVQGQSLEAAMRHGIKGKSISPFSGINIGVSRPAKKLTRSSLKEAEKNLSANSVKHVGYLDTKSTYITKTTTEQITL